MLWEEKNTDFFSKQVHVFLSILSTLLRRINSVHVLGILLESAHRVWYRYHTLWADSMSLKSGKGFKRGTTQFWLRIIIMWHKLDLDLITVRIVTSFGWTDLNRSSSALGYNFSSYQDFRVDHLVPQNFWRTVTSYVHIKN